MKNYIFIIFFFILYSSSVRCGLKTLRDANLDGNYITAGSGIDFTQNGSDKIKIVKKQMYEGELNVHMNWFDTFIDGLYLSMKVGAKIQVRQSTDDSAPVKTPGFMPRLTLFFWDKDNSNIMTNFENPTYFSLMLSHHSNGQSGAFYNYDGSINTENGSFSTNYFELSGYNLPYLKKLSNWTKLSLIWHPGFNREANLEDMYEKFKISFSLRTKSQSFQHFFPKSKFRALFRISYILTGRKYIKAPINFDLMENKGLPMAESKKAKTLDNFHLEARALWRPSWMQDMSWFLKYDIGYDYYNINFFKPMNRFQFGIIGNPFDMW